AEDGIRDRNVTGVQTCALPIYEGEGRADGGAVFGVLRNQEAHAEHLLEDGEDLAALGKAGEIADQHEVADRRVERRKDCALADEIGRASCRDREWDGVGEGALR